MIVGFKKLHADALPFTYAHEGDACMDMYSLEAVVIPPRTTVLIPTGIAIELPRGYEGIVRGRSGYALKGLFVHRGTIDENYRGDIGIIAYNTTDTSIDIPKHTRVAQFSIHQTTNISLIERQLTDTERGMSGYGSSGY